MLPDQPSDNTEEPDAVDSNAVADGSPTDPVGSDVSGESADAGGAVADEPAAGGGADGDLQPEDDASGQAEGDQAGAAEAEEEDERKWYILKVQVNREDSIRAALERRVKIEGLEEYFGDIVVPTEEVAEFNKSGKRKVVRRKLYPGYILAHMVINDETWFVVRETPGVGDFTGSAGRPTPMEPHEVERIMQMSASQEEAGGQIKTAIPYKSGDRVRVKDGHFQNFEGEVDVIDEANGRITVMINIFNRSTPVELEHWQVESV